MVSSAGIQRDEMKTMARTIRGRVIEMSHRAEPPIWGEPFR
jgi:hypothetical protein